MSRYAEAKKRYAEFGVDTEKAIETLKNLPVSLHCWQGDDVIGIYAKLGIAFFSFCVSAHF